MPNEVDISETSLLLEYSTEVIELLLKDHTTQQNIYWATDSYSEFGDGYGFYDPITIEKITGDNDNIIIPRAVKSREEQSKRAKDKAEVFTPSWVCNTQNNLIDEAWFDRPDVFNTPDPDDPHNWIDTTEPITFPEGKTWKDYVADIRLEITCGEAPYLVSRYDTVSGEPIDITHRIGLLDRKLRVVSENVHESKDWLNWAKLAVASIYGFEWQGDNLLLAREAIFFTFKDYYIAKFGERKYNRIKSNASKGLAYIISWNIWQMNGLTFGLPGYEDKLSQREDAEKQYQKQCQDIENKYTKACEDAENRYQKQLAEFNAAVEKARKANLSSLFANDPIEINKEEPVKEIVPKPVYPEPLPERDIYERYCEIKNFVGNVNINKKSIDSRNFLKDAQRCTFKDLVNKTDNHNNDNK